MSHKMYVVGNVTNPDVFLHTRGLKETVTVSVWCSFFKTWVTEKITRKKAAECLLTAREKGLMIRCRKFEE